MDVLKRVTSGRPSLVDEVLTEPTDGHGSCLIAPGHRAVVFHRDSTISSLPVECKYRICTNDNETEVCHDATARIYFQITQAPTNQPSDGSQYSPLYMNTDNGLVQLDADVDVMGNDTSRPLLVDEVLTRDGSFLISPDRTALVYYRDDKGDSLPAEVTYRRCTNDDETQICDDITVQLRSKSSGALLPQSCSAGSRLLEEIDYVPNGRLLLNPVHPNGKHWTWQGDRKPNNCDTEEGRKFLFLLKYYFIYYLQ